MLREIIMAAIIAVSPTASYSQFQDCPDGQCPRVVNRPLLNRVVPNLQMPRVQTYTPAPVVIYNSQCPCPEGACPCIDCPYMNKPDEGFDLDSVDVAKKPTITYSQPIVTYRSKVTYYQPQYVPTTYYVQRQPVRTGIRNFRSNIRNRLANFFNRR